MNSCKLLVLALSIVASVVLSFLVKKKISIIHDHHGHQLKREQELIKWIESRGAYIGFNIQMNADNTHRGAFASLFYREDDVVAAIPLDICIKLENNQGFPAVRTLI